MAVTSNSSYTASTTNTFENNSDTWTKVFVKVWYTPTTNGLRSKSASVTITGINDGVRTVIGTANATGSNADTNDITEINISGYQTIEFAAKGIATAVYSTDGMTNTWSNISVGAKYEIH